MILGGDHLGPNRWRALPPDEAMDKACDLVAAYVSAGFTKIHLDCSFSCAGDPTPLTDDLVAERAARMIRAAEAAAGPEAAEGIRYVIGTEVYDHLEQVVDRFEDVANEISGIVIENV